MTGRICKGVGCQSWASGPWSWRGEDSIYCETCARAREESESLAVGDGVDLWDTAGLWRSGTVTSVAPHSVGVLVVDQRSPEGRTAVLWRERFGRGWARSGVLARACSHCSRGNAAGLELGGRVRCLVCDGTGRLEREEVCS